MAAVGLGARRGVGRYRHWVPRRAVPSPHETPLRSQLASNAKAMNIQCKVCMQTFLSTATELKLKEHSDNKHPKNDFYACFPHLKVETAE